MKPVETRPSARFAVVLALLLAASPAAVAVYDGYLASPDRYGRAIDEFKRPIYVGSEELIHDLEDKAGLGFVPRGAFFGYGGSSVLRCGEAENFEIDDHYVVVDGRQWIGETRRGSKVEPGDSGGPALVLNRRLGSAGTSSFPEQGVLVAVASGPDVKNAWDFELDSYHTATIGKAGWLSSVTGSGTLRLVQSLQDEWQISRSGSGRWETLNPSSYPLAASVLRFADNDR